jgi:hypothetical protein
MPSVMMKSLIAACRSPPNFNKIRDTSSNRSCGCQPSTDAKSRLPNEASSQSHYMDGQYHVSSTFERFERDGAPSVGPRSDLQNHLANNIAGVNHGHPLHGRCKRQHAIDARTHPCGQQKGNQIGKLRLSSHSRAQNLQL